MEFQVVVILVIDEFEGQDNLQILPPMDKADALYQIHF